MKLSKYIIFVIPCKEHEIKPGHWNCEHEQGFLQKPVLQRTGLLPAHLRSGQSKILKNYLLFVSTHSSGFSWLWRILRGIQARIIKQDTTNKIFGGEDFCKISMQNWISKWSMHLPDFSKNFSLQRSWFLHRAETAWKQECSGVSQFQNSIWRKFWFKNI